MAIRTRYVAMKDGQPVGRERAQRWRAVHDLAEALGAHVYRTGHRDQLGEWAEYCTKLGVGRETFSAAPDGSRWYVKTKWTIV